MDFNLRCNELKCRTPLSDQGVVTTCSHIFCVPCAKATALGVPPAGNVRICPACQTELPNPDDVVATNLNPTEDYKTSILSGLNPTIIMECAGRALSFYSYQTAQEIIYQEFRTRSLGDQCAKLNSQMEKLKYDAEAEITNMREKMKAMQMEQKALEQKCEKLAESCREKARAKQQLQKLYTQIKARQGTADMELAAQQDAESVLSAGNYNNANHVDGRQRHGRASSHGSGGSLGRQQQGNNVWHTPAPSVQGSRAGLQSARSAPVPVPSSTHRTRLFNPTYANSNTAYANHVHQGTPYRPALNSIDPNVWGNPHYAGYGGMSAGAKAGRNLHGTSHPSGFASMGAGGVSGFNMR